MSTLDDKISRKLSFTEQRVYDAYQSLFNANGRRYEPSYLQRKGYIEDMHRKRQREAARREAEQPPLLSFTERRVLDAYEKLVYQNGGKYEPRYGEIAELAGMENASRLIPDILRDLRRKGYQLDPERYRALIESSKQK